MLAAIDNLMKAPRAREAAMNRLYGFEETAGLEVSGLHPVLTENHSQLS